MKAYSWSHTPLKGFLTVLNTDILAYIGVDPLQPAYLHEKMNCV